MSFGLGHGRTLDDAPGIVGITAQELPPLPDAAMTDRSAGRLDPRRWFPHPSRPFEIEIGCGKGSFILAEAAARPDTNFLGLEWANEFYRYAADRVRRRNLANVRMLRTDATDFLKWRCPSDIIDVIHLYYSDPWPKTKHHKNRVIQHEFLANAWRCLRAPNALGNGPGGQLRIVTDHLELWAWNESFASEWTSPSPESIGRKLLGHPTAPFLRLPFAAPEWAEDDELVGTNYERKTTAAGRPPNAMVLCKLHA